MSQFCTLRPGAEIVPGDTLQPCRGYYRDGHDGVVLPENWSKETEAADGWSKETEAADGWVKET